MLPLVGQITVRVLQSQPVSIHGDMYYDLVVMLAAVRPTDTPPAPDQPVRLRVPNHLCPRPPRLDDVLELNLLMSQVNAVRFVT